MESGNTQPTKPAPSNPLRKRVRKTRLPKAEREALPDAPSPWIGQTHTARLAAS